MHCWTAPGRSSRLVLSIGIEATFWNKPVLLLAKCRYFYSDVAHVPANVSEIDGLLVRELQPEDKINSIRFGYYFMNGGITTKYYRSEMFSKHSFKGKTDEQLHQAAEDQVLFPEDVFQDRRKSRLIIVAANEYLLVKWDPCSADPCRRSLSTG